MNDSMLRVECPIVRTVMGDVVLDMVERFGIPKTIIAA
jgi:hypothetical protein